MKNLLLTALVLIGVTTKAQYFQHVYGTSDFEELRSGVNTFAQPQGHFMAGVTQDPLSFQYSLIATYTDVNGTPNFNNEYQITDPITGVVSNVHWTRVFEMNNGNGFGVVGVHRDPTAGTATPSKLFYLQLDPNGNVMNIFDYTPLPGAFIWDVNIVGNVTESATGNEIYITGGVQANAPLVHVFAMKLDVMSGAIIWSNIYDIPHGSPISREVGMDIIENPYNPLGQPEAMIVGFAHGSGASNDGFVIRVDANTGVLNLPWAVMYGTASSNDAFYSITVANSGAGGNQGFVIGGESNVNGNNDAWLIKVDPSGWGTIWSNLYDYSFNPGSNENCRDVIERFSPISGQYQYFMTGSTDNGFFGGEDVLVIKTDDLGNGLGEFTYGGANADRGAALDQYDNTAADGLSTFATGDLGALGSTDFYLIKSYYDGNSGCNEYLSMPNVSTGPGLYWEYYITDFNGFTPGAPLCSSSSVSDVQLCYNTTIPGASNARMAPAEPKGDKEAVVLPNPMGQGSPVAFVELEADMPATVEVAIYDMLGKQYYNGSHTLVKGNNQLPLDISNANMATGMYTVKVTGASIAQNILLIVK